MHIQLGNGGNLELYDNNEPVDLNIQGNRTNVLSNGVEYVIEDTLKEGSISVPSYGVKLVVVSESGSLSYRLFMTDVWNSNTFTFDQSPLYNNSEGLVGT